MRKRHRSKSLPAEAEEVAFNEALRNDGRRQKRLMQGRNEPQPKYHWQEDALPSRRSTPGRQIT